MTSEPDAEKERTQTAAGPLQPTAVAALLVALTALFALVAVASRPGVRSLGSVEVLQRGSGGGVFETLLAIFLVAAVGVLAFLVHTLLARGGRDDPEAPRFAFEPPPLSRIAKLCLVLVPLLLIAGVAAGAFFLAHGSGGAPQTPAGGVSPGTPQLAPSARPPSTGFDSTAVIAAGGVVLAVVVVLGAWVVRARLRRSRVEPRDVGVGLAGDLDESIEDLRREPDPRRAVIAAYARMERTLGAHGLRRRMFEAPLEYLARVLVELRASAAPAGRLTSLFERAKFSHHDVDATMRDDAIEALTRLRDELRSPR